MGNSEGAHVVCVKGLGTFTRGSSSIKDHELDMETICRPPGLCPVLQPLDTSLAGEPGDLVEKPSIHIYQNNFRDICFKRLPF